MEKIDKKLDIALPNIDLPKLKLIDREIDKVLEKLKEANALADELASKNSEDPESSIDEKLKSILEGKTIVEAVFGIIIAIEESSDPETIARMINAYFNS